MKLTDFIGGGLLLVLAASFTWRIPGNFYSQGVNAQEDTIIDIVFGILLALGAIWKFTKKSVRHYGFGLKPGKDGAERKANGSTCEIR